MFRSDFKPVCKMFVNLHIHNARRKHWHPKIYLITHFKVHTLKLSLFAINIECDVAVIKVTKAESCILYNIRANYDNNSRTLLHLLSNESRRLKSKFPFFSSTNRRIPHTLFQNSNRPFVSVYCR